MTPPTRAFSATSEAWGTVSMAKSTPRTFALLLLALPLLAQPDPARQLEAAIHREIVDGDLPAARDAYRAITADSSTPRPVAARALLQLGACQEKLGQRREAHATYARIVREF